MSEKKQRQQSEWAREKAAYGKVAKLQHDIKAAETSHKSAVEKHEEKLKVLRAALAEAFKGLAQFQQPGPMAEVKP